MESKKTKRGSESEKERKGKSIPKRDDLNHYYDEHPTMLSSPYTLHIDLFRRDNQRLTDLGKRIFKQIPFSGKKVLDYGCGLGGLLAFLKSEGAEECVGADIERHIVEDNSPYIDAFQLLEFPRLDLPAGCFDLVICSEVLEHTGKSRRFLEKILSWIPWGGLQFYGIFKKIE